MHNFHEKKPEFNHKSVWWDTNRYFRPQCQRKPWYRPSRENTDYYQQDWRQHLYECSPYPRHRPVPPPVRHVGNGWRRPHPDLHHSYQNSNQDVKYKHYSNSWYDKKRYYSREKDKSIKEICRNSKQEHVSQKNDDSSVPPKVVCEHNSDRLLLPTCTERANITVAETKSSHGIVTDRPHNVNTLDVRPSLKIEVKECEDRTVATQATNEICVSDRLICSNNLTSDTKTLPEGCIGLNVTDVVEKSIKEKRNILSKDLIEKVTSLACQVEVKRKVSKVAECAVMQDRKDKLEIGVTRQEGNRMCSEVIGSSKHCTSFPLNETTKDIEIGKIDSHQLSFVDRHDKAAGVDDYQIKYLAEVSQSIEKDRGHHLSSASIVSEIFDDSHHLTTTTNDSRKENADGCCLTSVAEHCKTQKVSGHCDMSPVAVIKRTLSMEKSMTSLCQTEKKGISRVSNKINLSHLDLSRTLLKQLFPKWHYIFCREPVVALEQLKNVSFYEKVKKPRGRPRKKKRNQAKIIVSSVETSEYSVIKNETKSSTLPEKELVLPDSTTDPFVFNEADEKATVLVGKSADVKSKSVDNILFIDPKVMTLSKTLQAELANGESATQKIFKIKHKPAVTPSTSSASVGTLNKKVPKLDISKLKNKLKNVQFSQRKKCKSQAVSPPKNLHWFVPESDSKPNASQNEVGKMQSGNKKVLSYPNVLPIESKISAADTLSFQTGLHSSSNTLQNNEVQGREHCLSKDGNGPHPAIKNPGWTVFNSNNSSRISVTLKKSNGNINSSFQKERSTKLTQDSAHRPSIQNYSAPKLERMPVAYSDFDHSVGKVGNVVLPPAKEKMSCDDHDSSKCFKSPFTSTILTLQTGFNGDLLSSLHDKECLENEHHLLTSKDDHISWDGICAGTVLQPQVSLPEAALHKPCLKSFPLMDNMFIPEEVTMSDVKFVNKKGYDPEYPPAALNKVAKTFSETKPLQADNSSTRSSLQETTFDEAPVMLVKYDQQISESFLEKETSSVRDSPQNHTNSTSVVGDSFALKQNISSENSFAVPCQNGSRQNTDTECETICVTLIEEDEIREKANVPFAQKDGCEVTDTITVRNLNRICVAAEKAHHYDTKEFNNPLVSVLNTEKQGSVSQVMHSQSDMTRCVRPEYCQNQKEFKENKNIDRHSKYINHGHLDCTNPVNHKYTENSKLVDCSKLMDHQSTDFCEHVNYEPIDYSLPISNTHMDHSKPVDYKPIDYSLHVSHTPADPSKPFNNEPIDYSQNISHAPADHCKHVDHKIMQYDDQVAPDNQGCCELISQKVTECNDHVANTIYVNEVSERCSKNLSHKPTKDPDCFRHKPTKDPDCLNNESLKCTEQVHHSPEKVCVDVKYFSEKVNDTECLGLEKHQCTSSVTIRSALSKSNIMDCEKIKGVTLIGQPCISEFSTPTLAQQQNTKRENPMEHVNSQVGNHSVLIKCDKCASLEQCKMCASDIQDTRVENENDTKDKNDYLRDLDQTLISSNISKTDKCNNLQDCATIHMSEPETEEKNLYAEIESCTSKTNETWKVEKYPKFVPALDSGNQQATNEGCAGLFKNTSFKDTATVNQIDVHEEMSPKNRATPVVENTEYCQHTNETIVKFNQLAEPVDNANMAHIEQITQHDNDSMAVEQVDKINNPSTTTEIVDKLLNVTIEQADQHVDNSIVATKHVDNSILNTDLVDEHVDNASVAIEQADEFFDKGIFNTEQVNVHADNVILNIEQVDNAIINTELGNKHVDNAILNTEQVNEYVDNAFATKQEDEHVDNAILNTEHVDNAIVAAGQVDENVDNSIVATEQVDGHVDNSIVATGQVEDNVDSVNVVTEQVVEHGVVITEEVDEHVDIANVVTEHVHEHVDSANIANEHVNSFVVSEQVDQDKDRGNIVCACEKENCEHVKNRNKIYVAMNDSNGCKSTTSAKEHFFSGNNTHPEEVSNLQKIESNGQDKLLTGQSRVETTDIVADPQFNYSLDCSCANKQTIPSTSLDSKTNQSAVSWGVVEYLSNQNKESSDSVEIANCNQNESTNFEEKDSVKEMNITNKFLVDDNVKISTDTSLESVHSVRLLSNLQHPDGVHFKSDSKETTLCDMGPQSGVNSTAKNFNLLECKERQVEMLISEKKHPNAIQLPSEKPKCVQNCIFSHPEDDSHTDNSCITGTRHQKFPDEYETSLETSDTLALQGDSQITPEIQQIVSFGEPNITEVPFYSLKRPISSDNQVENENTTFESEISIAIDLSSKSVLDFNAKDTNSSDIVDNSAKFADNQHEVTETAADSQNGCHYLASLDPVISCFTEEVSDIRNENIETKSTDDVSCKDAFYLANGTMDLSSKSKSHIDIETVETVPFIQYVHTDVGLVEGTDVHSSVTTQPQRVSNDTQLTVNLSSLVEVPLASPCSHIENISDGILYNNEVNIMTEPENSAISIASVIAPSYDSDETFIYSEGENSDSDRLFICESTDKITSECTDMILPSNIERKDHTLLKVTGKKRTGTKHGTRKQLKSKGSLKNRPSKECQNFVQTLQKEIQVKSGKFGQEEIQIRSGKCRKRRKVSNENIYENNIMPVQTRTSVKLSKNRKGIDTVNSSKNSESKKKKSRGKKSLQKSENDVDFPVSEKNVSAENFVKEIKTKKEIIMHHFVDDDMFTEIELEQNDVFIESKTIKQHVVPRRNPRGRSRKKRGKKRKSSNQKSNQKPVIEQLADSDDLPTIFPPKRRRVTMRPRMTVHAMAASTDSTRIMQEFPRHNWLQNKYKDGSSPEQTDLDEKMSQLERQYKDGDVSEGELDGITSQQECAEKDEALLEGVVLDKTVQHMEYQHNDLQQVSELDARVSQKDIKFKDGTSSQGEADIGETISQTEKQNDTMPNVAETDATVTQQDETSLEGETVPKLDLITAVESIPPVSLSKESVPVEELQGEGVNAAKIVLDQVLVTMEMADAEPLKDPGHLGQNQETKICHEPLEQAFRENMENNVDSGENIDATVVTTASTEEMGQPLNLSTKRIDGLGANFKLHPNPPIQKVLPQVQEPLVSTPDFNELIEETKAVIRHIKLIPAEKPALTYTTCEMNSHVTDETTAMSSCISSGSSTVPVTYLFPSVVLPLSTDQNEPKTLSGASLSSSQQTSVSIGTNSQHTSSVSVTQSGLPPIPCLIPITQASALTDDKTPNTTTCNSIPDDLETKPVENKAIPQTDFNTNREVAVKTVPDFDVIMATSKIDCKKRRSQAPEQVLGEPPNKAVCKRIPETFSTDEEKLNSDEPLSLIMPKINNQEKYDTDKISVLSYCSVASEMEQEEYENRLQQLKELSELTARKEKEYEEIVKMRQQKLEELKKIELNKSHKYQSRHLAATDSDVASVDTKSDTTSSKQTPSDLQHSEKIDVEKETVVSNVIETECLSSDKKDCVPVENEQKYVQNNAPETSQPFHKISDTGKVTEIDSSLNPDLTMEISISSDHESSHKVRSAHENKSLTGLLHITDKVRPAHENNKSLISLLHVIDKSMANMSNSLYNQKHGMYVHRKEPIFEAPLCLSRSKRKGQMKKAHCQPPFQTAGSLIVPLLSYFQQQPQPQPLDRNLDRNASVPTTPTHTNKGMVFRPVQQKPFDDHSLFNLSHRRLSQQTISVERERLLSTRNKIAMTQSQQPEWNSSGSGTLEQQQQCYMSSSAVMSPQSNAVHVMPSPQNSGHNVRLDSSVSPEVIDLSKIPDDENEQVVQKELHAAVVNRCRTDIDRPVPGGQKYLMSHQDIQHMESQQFSGTGQRIDITEETEPPASSHGGIAAETKIVFKNFLQQQRMTGRYRDIAPRPQNLPPSSLSSSKVVNENSTIKNALLTKNSELTQYLQQKEIRSRSFLSEFSRNRHAPQMIGRQPLSQKEEIALGQQNVTRSQHGPRQRMPAPLLNAHEQMMPNHQNLVQQHQFQQQLQHQKKQQQQLHPGQQQQLHPGQQQQLHPGQQQQCHAGQQHQQLHPGQQQQLHPGQQQQLHAGQQQQLHPGQQQHLHPGQQQQQLHPGQQQQLHAGQQQQLHPGQKQQLHPDQQQQQLHPGQQQQLHPGQKQQQLHTGQQQQQLHPGQQQQLHPGQQQQQLHIGQQQQLHPGKQQQQQLHPGQKQQQLHPGQQQQQLHPGQQQQQQLHPGQQQQQQLHHHQQQQQFTQQQLHHHHQQSLLHGTPPFHQNITVTLPSSVGLSPQGTQTVQLLGTAAIPINSHTLQSGGHQLSPVCMSPQQSNTGEVLSQASSLLSEIMTPPSDARTYIKHPLIHDQSAAVQTQVPTQMSLYPPHSVAMPFPPDSQHTASNPQHMSCHPAHRSHPRFSGRWTKLPAQPDSDKYVQMPTPGRLHFIAPVGSQNLQPDPPGPRSNLVNSPLVPDHIRMVAIPASSGGSHMATPQCSGTCVQDIVTQGPNRHNQARIKMEHSCTGERLISTVHSGGQHIMVTPSGGPHITAVPITNLNMAAQQTQPMMMTQAQFHENPMQKYPMENMQSPPSSQPAAPSKISQVRSDSPTVKIPKEPNPTPQDHPRTQPDTRTSPLEHSPPIVQMAQSNCIECNKLALYLCSSCKKVWYCSTKCQLQHWVSHSQQCKPEVT